jgi:hypothetical protein
MFKVTVTMFTIFHLLDHYHNVIDQFYVRYVLFIAFNVLLVMFQFIPLSYVASVVDRSMVSLLRCRIFKHNVSYRTY